MFQICLIPVMVSDSDSADWSLSSPLFYYNILSAISGN